MVVRLLALYADPEPHNAQHHRWTDGQTDDIMPNSPSYCVAIWSAQNFKLSIICATWHFQFKFFMVAQSCDCFHICFSDEYWFASAQLYATLIVT